MNQIIVPRFEVSGSTYLIDGVGAFPRVSTVLSQWANTPEILDAWKKKRFLTKIATAPNKPHSKLDLTLLASAAYDDAKMYTEQSAVFGNQMHDYFEHYLINGVWPELPKSTYADPSICAASMQKFAKDWGINKTNCQQLQPEVLLWSKEHGYAGMCDLLVWQNGRIFLFDHKTSTSDAGLKKYYVQVGGAYWHALKECHGIDITEAYIVKYNKGVVDYTTYRITPDEHKKYWELFKSMLHLYKYAND